MHIFLFVILRRVDKRALHTSQWNVASYLEKRIQIDGTIYYLLSIHTINIHCER
jgi:hypothetical protein